MIVRLRANAAAPGLWAAASCLVWVACALCHAAVISSDLVPKVGRGTPPPQSRGNGPWTTRIMLATSSNGVDFARLNFVLTDQAGVPNVMVDHDGRARVYYVDFGNGNVLACATLANAGTLTNWTFHRVRISGMRATQHAGAVDPCVLALPNHQYRLYFMLAAPVPAIYSATSTNGFDYAQEPGTRFLAKDDNGRPQPVFDPLVWRAADHFELWCGPEGRFHARSNDGLTFQASDRFDVDGARFMAWSATSKSDGGWRLYGNFIGPGEWSGGISSAASVDGMHWKREPGIRLSLDGSKYRLESAVAPDNGCALLPDGRWLLAYVATIPAPRPGR